MATSLEVMVQYFETTWSSPTSDNFSSEMDVFTSMARNIDARGLNGSWVPKQLLWANKVPWTTSVSNTEVVAILLLELSKILSVASILSLLACRLFTYLNGSNGGIISSWEVNL